MRRFLGLTVLLVLVGGTAGMAQHWPHWRGPSHDGVSTETGLPVSWNAECVPSEAPEAGDAFASGPMMAEEATVQPPQRRPGGGGGGGQEGRPLVPVTCEKIETSNVSWKLPLPAYSGSTPIIWGDMIFLNVATGANTGELELWAVDRRTQDVAWKRLLVNANHMERKQNMS